MSESRLLIGQSVQDIMIRWPQTIPVFLDHHMNCVGCSMAAFEVLEDALNIYCLPVEPFMDQISKAIEAYHGKP